MDYDVNQIGRRKESHIVSNTLSWDVAYGGKGRGF